MSVTATRKVEITYLGEGLNNSMLFPAITADNSPAICMYCDLIAGNNTITLPTVSSVVKSVTIVPPPANTVPLTLKGVAGDTGIKLHVTDPTSIGIDSSVTSIIVNATAPVYSTRFVWT